MNTQSPFAFYLSHPVFFIRRFFLKLHELKHPEEPWISQRAILFCQENLKPTQVGWEWGSGRSTAWFAKRLKSLNSIEHHPDWHERVRSKLESNHIHNVTYQLIPLDHDVQLPTQPHYDILPKYVAAIQSVPDEDLDFVVVDGHYRQACVLAALPKLKRGGFLLIDNSNWLPLTEWQVPDSWKIVHQSQNVMTQTTIWQKP